MLRFSLAGSLLWCALASNSTAQSIVVPPSRATTEGNFATSDPFAPMVGRFQQIVSGTEIGPGATIRALGLRMDGGIPVALLGVALPGYTVRMAHAATTPATMSETFQANGDAAGGVVMQLGGSFQ